MERRTAGPTVSPHGAGRHLPALAAAAILAAGIAQPTRASEPTAPETVSPGSTQRVVEIAGPCPTFSWGAVPGTDRYDLEVYALDQDGQPGSAKLRERLPGTASSWTPPLAHCLEPGRYVWVLRGSTGTESDDATGGWSVPRLFEVPGAARPGPEWERTLAPVIERILAERAGGTESGPVPGGTRSAAATSLPAPATGTALDGTDFSIDGSGNVLGASFGGDGSGLTNLDWAALVNVPAGFADGVDDAIAYAAGNQLHLSGTTFGVVEGSGSDLDADLLDGLEAAAFALEAETYTMAEVDALLTIDNIAAPIPGAPSHLRLTPNPSFPGMRRLWWNMDSLVGVASFVVYQAAFPITDTNKRSAHRRVTPSLYAPAEVFPGSGIVHFRVEAVNVLGEAGPLSEELALDTTSRILYIADQRQDELFELFTVPATGGGSTRVSDDLIAFGDVLAAAWSPDGSRIAYTADQDTDGVLEIFVASAEGGGAVKINDPLPAGRNALGVLWSPDGSRLAYVSDQETEGIFELYVAPATGGGAIKVSDDLVPGGTVQASFAWSPDGTRLAYLADQDTRNVDELYVVPATGGGAVKINDPLVPGGNVRTLFSWSPDASHLAYRADQETDGVFELYVAPATGGDTVKVSDELVPGGDVQQTFSWSPDGSRLAYRADQDEDEFFELYVTPATGAGGVKVSDPPDPGFGVQAQVHWSPGGTHLAYRAAVEGRIHLFVVPATGGGAVLVNDPLPPGGNVTFWSLQSTSWSPDGSRIAYRADQDTDDVFELYVAPATGGGSVKINGPLPAGGDVSSMLTSIAAWSPDGSRLAYRADQDADDVFELYVAPVTGGSSIKINDPLPAGGEVFNFQWSPLGVE